MSKAALLELAGRVEKASGPDRELDVLILTQALGYRDIMGDGSLFDRGNDGYWTLEGDERNRELPSPTSSLDAAMTLVPEGAWWEIVQTCAPTSPMRNFGSQNGMFRARTAKQYGEHGAMAENDQPALALTAACLRARAEMEPSDD